MDQISSYKQLQSFYCNKKFSNASVIIDELSITLFMKG